MARSAHAAAKNSFAYRPALDGLRAVAVVAVLLFHSGFSWARGGYLGVSAFFTLSGFLITTLLLIEYRTEGRISLGAFWARRARRLLPTAFLAVAIAALYVVIAAPHHIVVEFRGDGLAALFDVANWRFVLAGRGYLDTFAAATGIQPAQSPVLHFWSLAIEEQFYLLFPPLLFGLLRVARGRLGIVAGMLGGLTLASVSVGLMLGSGADNSRAYFGTDTRAAELLVGALLAVAFVARGPLPRSSRAIGPPGWPSVLGALALVGSMVAWSTIDHADPVLFRGGLAAHALLTATVIAGAIQPGWFGRMLSWRPLVGLGKISYGIYVFHWPIFQWLDGRGNVGRGFDGWANGLSGWRLLAVRTAVTLVISLASYWAIEQPIRHGRAGRAARWSLVPAWVALSALVIGAWSSPPAATTVFSPVAARTASGTPTPADAAVREIDAELPAMPTPTSAPPTSSAAERTAERRRNGPQRVLIVGDSVALTLGRGLERWGVAHDVAVWNLGRATCGIPRSELHVGYERIRSDVCEAWPELWSTAIEGFDPDVVVVLSPIWDSMAHQPDGWDRLREVGDPEYDRWLLGEYHAAGDVLSAGGARIYWLDVPCGEGKEISDAAVELNLVIDRLARERADTERISLRRLLCDATGEFADSRDDDGYHFSDSGADLMAEWLIPQLSS